jgi:hypothetical protein
MSRPILVQDRHYVPRCDSCETPISDPYATLSYKMEGGKKAFGGFHLCYDCSQTVWKAIKENELGKRLIATGKVA